MGPFDVCSSSPLSITEKKLLIKNNDRQRKKFVRGFFASFSHPAFFSPARRRTSRSARSLQALARSLSFNLARLERKAKDEVHTIH